MKRIFTIILILITNSVFVSAQPVLVKKITPSSKNFISVGNDVFYTSGDSLIKIVGSTGDRVVVKIGLKEPSQMTKVNNLIYFVNNKICGGYSCYWKELWRSDGTAGGTFVVKYFKSVSIVNHIGSTVFLAADEYSHGLELWKTNGTLVTTSLIKDINPGTESSLDYYENFSATVYNDRLYFSADDGLHGKEVWISDGSTPGTTLFRDIQPGPHSSEPTAFTVSGNNMYFKTINSDTLDSWDTFYNKLWKVNGPGLTLMKDFGPNYYSIDKLIDVNGTLFFTMGFLVETPYSTEELWKSNAASWNTVLVKKLFDHGYWYNLINVNGTLVAASNFDGTGGKLWRSDGSSNGTFVFWNTDNYNQEIEMQSINDILFFNAVPPTSFFYYAYNENVDLWRSDVTKEGTARVRDLYPDMNFSYEGVRNLMNVNNTLYFTSDDSPVYTYDPKPSSLWKYNPEPFVVDNLILVNTETGEDIRSLKMNDTVYTDQKVTIKALTSGYCGSVMFLVNDKSKGSDNVKPYTISGDNGSHYNEWNTDQGVYKISAIPYSGGNGTGTPGNTFIRYVSVISPSDTSHPAPVAMNGSSLDVGVYPNPVLDKVLLNCSSSTSQNVSVQLFDYYGNKCFAQEYYLISGRSSIQMDFTSLNIKSGFYFLKIVSDEDGEKTIKIYKY